MTRRRPRDPFGHLFGLLQDELGPLVQVLDLRPPFVQLVDVDLVVDLHELEQVEQEQRHVAVGDGRHVRDARRSGHPGIQLTEPKVARSGVQEEVKLEVPSVALPSQPFAHRDRPFAGVTSLLLREEVGRYVVAAPATVVGRELLEADELGHEGTDQRAVPGDHALDRQLPRLDPLHHLELFAGDLPFMAIPVPAVGDEERRLARITVRRLHHEVVPEPTRLRKRDELRVRRRGAHRVGDAGHPGLVTEPCGLDLGIEPVAERGRREHDVEAKLVGELFGLAVEHQERGLPGPVGRDQIRHLLVRQQVIHDLLDRPERSRRLLAGDEHVGMPAVERVVVVDELECADPPIDPKQVERGRAHEVDGRLGRSEEVADRRDAGEGLRVDDQVRPGRSGPTAAGAGGTSRRQPADHAHGSEGTPTPSGGHLLDVSM